ncbi:MAG: hypothetical protein ACKVW3_02135 [Phycisphaerales bacterium]
MTQAIRTLMASLIDYAGLFPPAKLAMGPAAEAFARSQRGEDSWVLARFICPASRLAELSKAAAAMMPGTFATSGYREQAEVTEPWRVSAIIDGALEKDLEAIAGFNSHHEREDHGLAAVDAIEMKVTGPAQIDDAIELIPDEVFPFFEFGVSGDCRGMVAALAGHAAGAKIRTGGVTAEAFPAPEQVAAFIVACAGAEVPFKATAGLHHPIRAEYPLTYEPGCPRGTMHGFLNLFVASAFVQAQRIDARRAAEVLEERDASTFKFTDEGVRWKGLFAETAQIAKAREVLSLSYGSCSFDEPVGEMKALGLM